MEDNFEQLKTLKNLLESGAISKTEYDSMKADLLRKSMAGDGVKSAMESSAFSKLLKKYKWILIIVPVLVIGGFLFWNSLKVDPKIEAEALAKKKCDCQAQNNIEYISRLNAFILAFESKGYEFSNQVDTELAQISHEYEANTFNVSILKCTKDVELKTIEMIEKYNRATSDGKDFWFAYQSKIAQNIDLIVQMEQISNLEESADKKKSSLVYSNPADLTNRKNTLKGIMTNYYYYLSTSTLDAYDYFAYSVEKYFGKSNISPTDINILLKSENDYKDSKFKFVPETLHLILADNQEEIWEYSTEFQTFRPSKEMYQICNIWYEVKFNKSDKIMSYKEKKVENSKYLTIEEYNEITDGGNSGQME